LSTVHKGLDPLLDLSEISGSTLGTIAYAIRKGCSLLWVGFQGIYHIHPVQGMEMIKVDNVVMLKLGTMKQVSKNTCIVGYFDAYGIFNCPHRGQVMGVSSDPAGSLNKKWGISWVTPSQDDLNSPEHLSRTPGIDNLAAFNFHLDPQMTFNPCNRINHHSLAHNISSLCSKSYFTPKSNRIFPYSLASKKGVILSQKFGSLQPMQG
jgi:hypothetical protein